MDIPDDNNFFVLAVIRGIEGNSAGFVCEGTGNIFIGLNAGSSVTTGNNNIIIGNNIKGSSSSTNWVNIGNKIAHESGTLYSANSTFSLIS